jgi:hypothetical protein
MHAHTVLQPATYARILLCAFLGIGLGSAHGRAFADSTVVFNEIMYHPPGNEAQLEWIELYNQMAVDMDISRWSLGGGVRFDFPEGTIVRGGGLLVIAASPQALKASTGFGAALGPLEGRLDNSGERLDLLNNNGRVMDSIKYGDGGAQTPNKWPAGADGSGASLAKVSPDAASDRGENWSASARVGGTPGEHNFLPASLKTLPDSLVSYWSFDQASGQAVDTAGGNNGTLGSGATRVAGIVGSRAVTFNNSALAFVSVGSGVGGNFSFSSGMTIEAILEPGWSGAEGDYDDIFRKDDGEKRLLLAFQNDAQNGAANPPVPPGPVLSFGLKAGGVYSELDMPLDGEAGRPALSGLTDGSHHHLAATYDSSSGLKAIYVDGALAFSVALAPGGLIESGGNTVAYIGNTNGRTEPFTGVLDEVAIWKRSLSAAEIHDHFDKTLAGMSYFEAGSDPSPPPPRIAFNETFVSTREAPWLEIINFGDHPVELEGHVLSSLTQPGKEYVLPARTLAPAAYLALSQAELPFQMIPSDKLFLFSPDRTSVLAAVRLEDGLRGRYPDGSGEWLYPDRSTPGAPNSFSFHAEVVINEIMYHHRQISDTPFEESPESWIELFNRSAQAVNLTGWRLDGGIDYGFADGTSLAPGEYLVVAKDKEYLTALYPQLRVLGNFEKNLSHKSDRIVLKDSSGNPANEVQYRDRGRWPSHADGGGSSLELKDPRAENTEPEAWQASDESGKPPWRTYKYRGVAAANVGPTRWNELVLGLLDEGEALVDDISVIETPATTPKELIQNGGFDEGEAHWRFLGNHGFSEVIEDPDDPTNSVLHLVATGATEHMHNHVETTLAGGARVVNGREYEISFNARWLGGSNQLNTRLYFNRLPRTTLLEVPRLNGTPGARNSRYEPNVGPTFEELAHGPVAPAAGQEVTVSVVAADPDGVSSSTLFWSVNGGSWQSGGMTRDASGRQQGKIPGQAAAALVQFYVEARDTLGAASTFPRGGPDSRALYRVADGQAILGRVHNLRILMTAADANFLHLDTNVMSNQWMGATLVYDEREVFYDVGVRLKGSERGRPVAARVGFHIKLQPDHLFRGVHETIAVDRSGGWKFGGPFGQDEILIKHVINHAGGIPGMYDDLIRVIAPRAAQTGSALLMMAAFEDTYLDSQYSSESAKGSAKGSDGTEFKLELIYYPTTTANGSPEGLKRPEPDDVTGTDLRDLGNDKEVYRWNFLIENNLARDDYGPLISLCKAFGLPAAQLEAGTKAVMDVDEWMRTFAIYALCGINDTYTFGNNHNNIYYLRPEDKKMLVFPWDMDFAFVLSTSGALWGDQNLSRIIQLPANKRLLYGHLNDIIATTFNTNYMARWTAHYGSLCGQDFSSILTYISQRRSFVLSSLPADVPFEIVTQNGQDFTVNTISTVMEGNAWIDVARIFLTGRDEPLDLAWPTVTRWRTTVDLDFGLNPLEFLGLDSEENVIVATAINVTSTQGWPRPKVTSVTPPGALPGESVTVAGTSFHNGLKVFFGSAPAAQVQFDEAASPGELRAVVPGLPGGPAGLTVQNSDGRKSPPVSFTVILPNQFLRGDVDLDQAVDLPDAVRLLFHLFQGLPISCQDAADADNNETLNLADVIHILNYLFRAGQAPAAPYPFPGSDLDGDGPLGCEKGLGE